jgi:hypothetical protein
MKLTKEQLENQVLEFSSSRNGEVVRVEPFVPHQRPDTPIWEEYEIPVPKTPDHPNGRKKLLMDISEHSSHAVLIKVDPAFEPRSFVVRCDGTVISAQG